MMKRSTFSNMISRVNRSEISEKEAAMKLSRGFKTAAVKYLIEKNFYDPDDISTAIREVRVPHPLKENGAVIVVVDGTNNPYSDPGVFLYSRNWKNEFKIPKKQLMR